MEHLFGYLSNTHNQGARSCLRFVSAPMNNALIRVFKVPYKVGTEVSKSIRSLGGAWGIFQVTAFTV